MKVTELIQVLQSSVVETGRFMQGRVVELIRELMQAQHMSVRKISAQIAHEQGGSAMGYTQQINRILNDPDYDPNFSTVQKILAALNYSLWQSAPADLATIEAQLNHLSSEMTTLKATVATLSESVQMLALSLSSSGNGATAGLREGTGDRRQETGDRE